MLPRKYDIANSGSVAVDAYEAEGEGDLGHPRAPSLNQEVSKDQAEDSEQGEDGPVLRAGKTQKQTRDSALPGDFCFSIVHSHNCQEQTRKVLKFNSFERALLNGHVLSQEFKL